MTDIVETTVEKETPKFHLHITGSDSLGLNFIENIVKMANLGAVIKPGTIPAMRFPHSLSMILEAEQPPTPSACIRVFEFNSNKEVFAAFVEPKAATFSMDNEDEENNEDEVDKSTNNGTPWTKEQLLAMDFDTELRAVCKSVGITGRSKDKMIKEYLAKFA